MTGSNWAVEHGAISCFSIMNKVMATLVVVASDLAYRWVLDVSQMIQQIPLENA